MSAITPLKHMSELPPADRAETWRKLVRAPAEGTAAGWQAWELDEYVRAVARSLGVQLSIAQTAWLIALAQPK
jgi:hypothetical protein